MFICSNDNKLSLHMYFISNYLINILSLFNAKNHIILPLRVNIVHSWYIDSSNRVKNMKKLLNNTRNKIYNMIYS